MVGDFLGDYYLTGGCVVIVTLLLTSTEVSQVDNMSKSQCCPLYCHGGGRRALFYYGFRTFVGIRVLFYSVLGS